MSRFTVIGDATLDVTVAPAARLRRGGDVPAAIRIGPGGQGANVAVRLARRGAHVRLAAALGDDAAGRMLREGLEREGVELAALSAAGSAVVVALLDADGERSMFSDRRPLPAAALDVQAEDATWIHVSGYALLDDSEGDALAAAIGRRPDPTRLSVAGGSLRPDRETAERFRARLVVARPDLLLVSHGEAAALLGTSLSAAAVGDGAARLAGLATIVIVTAGSRGSAATLEGTVHEVPAIAAGMPVRDATGSGDAYLAALLAELGSGDWPPTEGALRGAMRRGSRAGSEAARALGAQARIDDDGGSAA